MGVVYRAHGPKLGRDVAIKLLQQARAASAPDHPNIMTIYDIDEWNDQPFIVMQYVDGQSLRERLAGSVGQ